MNQKKTDKIVGIPLSNSIQRFFQSRKVCHMQFCEYDVTVDEILKKKLHHGDPIPSI